MLLHCPLILLVFFFTSGQGLLSQSALQLNNQDAYAAAGYHSNQGLALGETVTSRSGQVGGAVHSYNQVHTHVNSSEGFFFSTSLLHFFHPSASLSVLSLFTHSLLHASVSCPILCSSTHFFVLALSLFLFLLVLFPLSFSPPVFLHLHTFLLACCLTSSFPHFSHLSPHAAPLQVTSSRAAAQLAGTDSPSQSQRDSFAQQAHGSAFHMPTEGGSAPAGPSMYYSCATLPAQVQIPEEITVMLQFLSDGCFLHSSQ